MQEEAVADRAELEELGAGVVLVPVQVWRLTMAQTTPVVVEVAESLLLPEQVVPV
jgi:hypothetical protein